MWLTECTEILQSLLDIQRFTDDSAECQTEYKQHGMLGADFAILYGQYFAECSAYTDKAGA